jgi:glyoxylase I family protein
MAEKNLHHICIQTDKYEESLKFYTEVADFKIVKETKGFHSRDYNTWLKLGDLMIELQTPKRGESFGDYSKSNNGPVHLCFMVGDIQKEYEYIKQKGCNSFKLKNGKEIYSIENSSLFKIKAPEGTEIEYRDNPKI